MENENRVILNLMDVESRTDVRNISRTFLLDEFYTFLSEKFSGVRRTGLGEFAVPVAYTKDADGFAKDIYGKIEVSIPNWWDVVGEKRTSKAYNPNAAQYDWEHDLTTPKKLGKEEKIRASLNSYKEYVEPEDMSLMEDEDE